MALKSITLRAGDCVILPKDAVVTSVIINGSLTYTADCTLPAPTTYKCGVFYLFTDVSGEDDSAMEDEHVTYTQVTIGDTTFLLNELVDPTSEMDLNTHVTDLALFEFKAVTRTVLGERQRLGVYFQVPEDLFDETVLQISDRGTLYNLPPYEAECGVYENPA